MSDRPDRTRGEHGDQDGSVTRPLLWLVAGLATAVVLGFAMAPELLTDLAAAGEVGLVVVAAGFPGLLAVVMVAARRRGRDDEPTDAASRDTGSRP